MLTKGCKFHIGKNPKGFSLRSREPSEEIPFGKLENCMFEQIRRMSKEFIVSPPKYGVESEVCC